MKIWSISDVESEKKYHLLLCQSREGKRYFKLLESSLKFESTDVFAKTTVVENDLLIQRNLKLISNNSKLIDGSLFYVDPHGMWITQNESEQLEKGIDFFEVNWDTKESPDIAKR